MVGLIMNQGICNKGVNSEINIGIHRFFGRFDGHRGYKVYTVDRLMKEKGAVHGPFYRRSEGRSEGCRVSSSVSSSAVSALVKPHELHFVMLWGNTHVVYRVPEDHDGVRANSDGYKVVFRGRVGQLTGAYRAKGRRRKRAYGREGLAYWAIKRLVSLVSLESDKSRARPVGPVTLVVKLRGFGQGRRGVVKGLSRGVSEFPGAFAVLKLLEVRSLAHNGCRARKSRRL